MNRFTHELLKRLKEDNISFGLANGKSHIMPRYKDQSILNLPSSICHWFGIPEIHHTPFPEEILKFTEKQFKRIVLMLIDGLSFNRFQSMLTREILPVWKGMIQSGILAPISSIVPSTTSSAITTLWTGHSPIEHAVLGYELWLKEYGIVANMITQSPISYYLGKSSIENAGFQPEQTLTMHTLGQHLQQSKISGYSLQHSSIANSGLSRTFLRDTDKISFTTKAEMWTNLIDLLSLHKQDSLFAWIYWGDYDHLSHKYGPDDIRTELELKNYSRAFEENFIKRIPSELKKDTLIIMTADHGQIHTPPNPHFDLKNHPELLRCLHIKPTGESRLAFLHLKPGKKDAVFAYFEKTWPGKFDLYDSAKLVENGLFGPGRPHETAFDRVGDLIVIPRNNSYLWWQNQENNLLGRHGGLSESEMVVPFITAVL